MIYDMISKLRYAPVTVDLVVLVWQWPVNLKRGSRMINERNAKKKQPKYLANDMAGLEGKRKVVR